MVEERTGFILVFLSGTNYDCHYGAGRDFHFLFLQFNSIQRDVNHNIATLKKDYLSGISRSLL